MAEYRLNGFDPTTLLDFVKSSQRITHDVEDDLIVAYIAAAADYILDEYGQSVDHSAGVDVIIPANETFLEEIGGKTYATWKSGVAGYDTLDDIKAHQGIANHAITIPARKIKQSLPFLSPSFSWEVPAKIEGGPEVVYSTELLPNPNPEGAPLSRARIALAMMVGHWYANREATTEAKLNDTPLALDALLGRPMGERWQP